MNEKYLPHIMLQSLSCWVLFFLPLSLSVFCLSVSQFLSLIHTLSLPLSFFLSGIIWLVLIYSHHYLVLGEDKHAFACLMNQTPRFPSVWGHTCTHTHRHSNIQAGTHTHTPAAGLAGLYLLASVMKSPAANNCRTTHGFSIHNQISSWNDKQGNPGPSTSFNRRVNVTYRKEIKTSPSLWVNLTWRPSLKESLYIFSLNLSDAKSSRSCDDNMSLILLLVHLIWVC